MNWASDAHNNSPDQRDGLHSSGACKANHMQWDISSKVMIQKLPPKMNNVMQVPLFLIKYLLQQQFMPLPLGSIPEAPCVWDSAGWAAVKMCLEGAFFICVAGSGKNKRIIL